MPNCCIDDDARFRSLRTFLAMTLERSPTGSCIVTQIERLGLEAA